MKDSEKEVAKKEDKVPKESERTAKQTKVDSIAKNSTAIESESESENGTKTTAAPKITKSRVPILSGGWNIMIIWFLWSFYIFNFESFSTFYRDKTQSMIFFIVSVPRGWVAHRAHRSSSNFWDADRERDEGENEIFGTQDT